MKSTQSDRGLYFDGAGDNGVKQASRKYAYNQHSGHSNDGRLVNYGSQHRVGNTGGRRTPGTDAVPGHDSPRNPDAINHGKQVRNAGGTRAWEPKCEQNYRGNPDRINSGRGPTKGNQQ